MNLEVSQNLHRILVTDQKEHFYRFNFSLLWSNH